MLVPVLTLLYLQALDIRHSADRRVGISLDRTPAGGVVVDSVVPGLPAEHGGLRPGDVLVAIGGLPIDGQIDYDVAAAAFERNRPVTYLVRRGAGMAEVVVRPGAPASWWRFLVTAVSALLHVALALLVIHQRVRDRRGVLLALLVTAVAIELSLPAGTIGSPTLSLVAGAAVYLLNGSQMAFELHLASHIPERHSWARRHPWVIKLFYVIGLGLGAAACVSQLVEGLTELALPVDSGSVAFLLDELALPVWALALVGLLGYQTLRYPEAQGRHQAGLVLLGSLPWVGYVLAATLSSVGLLALPGWTDAALPIVLLCYPLAVFVAIFRYHLLDLELVVRRSLVYTALTSTLLLVFYAALGAGGALFSQVVDDGEQSVWVVSAATLLLGLLFAPLRRVLQDWIDRRFFPERQAVRQQLTALAGELAVLGKLPSMGKHLVTSLSRIFGVRPVTLLLADPETGLLVTLASTDVDVNRDFDQSFLLSPHDPGVVLLRASKRALPATLLAERSPALRGRLAVMHAALAVPILGPSDLVGVLLLGEKATAQSYRAEELELLNLLAHHVATVFENARLFESATYESLTGLLRREAILEQLERELQRAVRYRRPLTIGMADLDHFKNVNDRFGHLAGDALLKRVAQTLQGELRSADGIGRYGGEEFLLVLPETDLAAAVRVAEKVRARVERTRLPVDDGEEVGATVSIGLGSLGELPANEAPSVRDLIELADRSLYRAKKAGRNRVEPAGAVVVDAAPVGT